MEVKFPATLCLSLIQRNTENERCSSAVVKNTQHDTGKETETRCVCVSVGKEGWLAC